MQRATQNALLFEAVGEDIRRSCRPLPRKRFIGESKWRRRYCWFWDMRNAGDKGFLAG
jgi:hypothetical protein